jgi:hypothetical protein
LGYRADLGLYYVRDGGRRRGRGRGGRGSTSETGANAGWRVAMSKFEELSGSRISMLMVRQLSVRESVVTWWIMDIFAGWTSSPGGVKV